MRNFLLGLFLLAVLGVLGAYTLFLTDASLFREAIRLYVQLPEARGLRDGDSVQVAGVRLGRVEKISFDVDAPQDRRVVLTLLMEQKVPLKEDYSIRVVDATLLGGHIVRIEPGTPGTLPLAQALDAPLKATIAADPFSALTGLGSLSDSIGALVDELRAGGAGQNLNQTLDNLNAATADLKKISADLAAGKGSLGELLSNNEFYDTWRGVGDDLSTLVKSANEGEGLLAALLKDAELRDRVRTAVDSATQALDNIAKLTNDDGTDSAVRVLLRDPEVAEQVRNITKNVEDVTGRLSRGEGTLGELMSGKSNLLESADQILADVKKVTAQVAAGEGTIGKLVFTDTIFDQLNLALRTLTRSLEDYREAAPIATFTSVLFQAF